MSEKWTTMGSVEGGREAGRPETTGRTSTIRRWGSETLRVVGSSHLEERDLVIRYERRRSTSFLGRGGDASQAAGAT